MAARRNVGGDIWLCYSSAREMFGVYKSSLYTIHADSFVRILSVYRWVIPICVQLVDFLPNVLSGLSESI